MRHDPVTITLPDRQVSRHRNATDTKLRSRKYQLIPGGALNSLRPPHPLRLAEPGDLCGASAAAFGHAFGHRQVKESVEILRSATRACACTPGGAWRSRGNFPPPGRAWSY